ncbi:MAG TPA: response regulator [Candidatus Saccharimonadales bacterium]|nr:response regulator [Candidatus Saccharimonadales bacterium]
MKRIVLIEPNSVLAKLYRQMLQKNGYDVVHVTTAQAGIDAVDAAKPHAVVLELQIPTHNGIEFLHEFRSYPEWNDIPVIVNTVITPERLQGLEESFTQDLAVGAILYKPKTSLDQLLLALKEQLP